jgi:hypothetical protein
MATVTATVAATAMVTAMVMVDGNRNVNCQRRWQRQWATAAAIAMELASATETAMAIALATATARATMTKGGLPLHVVAICSAVVGATHCLHPLRHKGVCIHQRCIMGVTLQRVFAPFQGGGVPGSSPWIVVFFSFKYFSVY